MNSLKGFKVLSRLIQKPSLSYNSREDGLYESLSSSLVYFYLAKNLPKLCSCFYPLLLGGPSRHPNIKCMYSVVRTFFYTGLRTSERGTPTVRPPRAA
jgi:hypothetical protein